jgi:hypothetical protein
MTSLVRVSSVRGLSGAPFSSHRRAGGATKAAGLRSGGRAPSAGAAGLYLIQAHNSISPRLELPPIAGRVPPRPGESPGVALSSLLLKRHRRRKTAEQRFQEQLRIKERLVEALEAIGDHRRAGKVRDCHSAFVQYRCSGGHEFARPVSHCRQRLCPFCQRDTTKRYLARYRWWLDGLVEGHRGKYVVLAMRNVPLGCLGSGVDALWAAFRRLQKLPGMEDLRNALAKLELTFNRADGSWHPHLNVVFAGSFLPFGKLNAAWRKASQGGRTTWIRQVNRGTARELLKYVCKSTDFVDVPEAVQEFVSTMSRRQILRRYGSFRKLGRPGDEIGGPGGTCLRCPDCGTSEVQRVGLVGLREVVCDERGVLRIRNP